jgi:hypothetical protein
LQWCIGRDNYPYRLAARGERGRHRQAAHGGTEIYVHYGDGMAATMLRIPAAATGSARNMNTIAKLIELAR